MIELDVPAHTVVRIERDFASDVERDGTEVFVADAVITVWIFAVKFSVSVGIDRNDYDFSRSAEMMSKFPRARI